MAKLLKIRNLLSIVRKTIDSGDYIFTGHAGERLQLREVTRLEVKQALKSGFHEKKKDKYDYTFDNWNYSIRGKTIDKRKLRVIVSFDDDGMLIITIIDV